MPGKNKIVLLAAMPRAGSTWILRMLNELWVTNGGADYLEIRDRYHLEQVMTHGSALVELKLPQLLKVIYPAWRHESYVVKSHASPHDPSWRILSRALAHSLIVSGRFLPICLVRDPRDAVLSGHEYGQRALKTGKPNSFSKTFITIDSGIDWMTHYIDGWWPAWQRYDLKLLVRYEDLLTDFESSVAQILNHLCIQPHHPGVHEVLAKYQPGADPQVGTHFYKGEIGRFRDELTPSQQQICNQRFAAFLEELGYPPD